ncbi:MAG: four helix bundle protein [Patescibacteria group bacterium]|nr:four helix bundle protein [Patescibacteria group bacterium]MCL5093682.1 four helix bundle protein [Patescibacteria group bacterium]
MKDGFKSLIAWQKALEFSEEIYRTTKDFPKEELFGFTSQLRRSAISVPANIAEGYEKQHNKEYLQFLYITKDSLGEVETYLFLALKLGYINKTNFNQLEEKRKEVGGLIFGLIRKLK